MHLKETLLQTSDIARSDDLMRCGIGNWKAFVQSGCTVDAVLEAAQDWKAALAGIELPWLCWSVDPDWCLVQQQLVQSVGWTPVVGYDPRAGQPSVLPGSVLIDFNRSLALPVMYPHFPLEFAFACCDRLAFWHSDLLLRQEQMAAFAEMFETLADGEMAAVAPMRGLSGFLHPRRARFWELLGCMTRGASQSNFDNGCGWWVNFAWHPNCPSERERAIRAKYHWECGVGIKYWHTKISRSVRVIPEKDVAEGHFTRINATGYQAASPTNWNRDLRKDLTRNFTLADALTKLSLERYGNA